MESGTLAEDLRALGACYREIEELLARPRAELVRVAPGVSAWSPEHQLAHLALANELVCRNVRSLLKGRGALVVEPGEASPQALALLAEGRIPRGAAQSPRMVRPPETVQRELLEAWVADGRRELEALAAEAGAIAAATKRVPHQLLGPLTAAQWVRFAAVHTRHHLEIARESLAVLAESRG